MRIIFMRVVSVRVSVVQWKHLDHLVTVIIILLRFNKPLADNQKFLLVYCKSLRNLSKFITLLKY